MIFKKFKNWILNLKINNFMQKVNLSEAAQYRWKDVSKKKIYTYCVLLAILVVSAMPWIKWTH